MRQIAHVGAAVLFLDRHAEQAHVAELAPHVHWEFVVAVDLRGARRQLGLGELVHRVAQHVEGFAEAEVEDVYKRQSLSSF